jgi:uncharacterized Zn finger protein (UPF0148 family)
MKLNCLSCGHNFDIDQMYADRYDGEVKCWICGAMHELQTEHGSIRKVHLSERSAHPGRQEEVPQKARPAATRTEKLEPPQRQSQQQVTGGKS